MSSSNVVTVASPSTASAHRPAPSDSPCRPGWPQGVGRNGRRQGGFTLMDMGIALAVIAILATVAIPSYRAHIQRSRLGEGVAALADRRALMEQYYLGNRTYVSGPCATSVTVGAFTLVCASTPTANAYTITATGSGTAAGAVYTVDHHGDARTTGLPTGWGTPPTGGYPCWITRKGDTC
ncbi:type IV pilin protein [Sphaerotilus microaerophilus]|nr:type IV pilin protein [Sphaerotilus sp. FB-5]